jgi:chorismate mutase
MRRSALGVRLLTKSELVIVVTLFASGIGMTFAQSSIDRLEPLVEISARRLALAEDVALAKWDTRTPVEDAPREEQVIISAVKEGESKGLDGTFVSDFFRAQIEANKVVQYSLLSEWYRLGRAPAHKPINLVSAIRPQLDKLQTELIGELARTADIRASSACPTYIAKAIGKYLEAHKQDVGQLEAIALDRAFAATCSARSPIGLAP